MAQTKADSLRADSIFKSLELQGVEIVKQKALVKSDIDKITYNIEDDPDSKSNSTLEMLRKVPMVTVDGEDKIQVNGSSSFKIYVNSKPNQMMSNNPSEVLKSMPASSIKRIEVITNPGPKYDAEGVGGILNIITHSKSIEGYTATFNANAGNQGLGGGVYATVKSGKLTVSANMDYSYYDRPTSYSGSTRKTIGNITESSSNIESEGTSKYHGDSKYGSIEASYEIDSLRLITAAFDLYGGSSTSNGESWALATSPLTGNQLYSYNTLRHSKSKYAYVDGGIDYQRTFKTEEKLFTLSYRIGSEPDASDSYTDYADLRAADALEDKYMSTIHGLLNALLYLPETEPLRRKAQLAVQLFKDFNFSTSDGIEAEARKTLNMVQQWRNANDYTLQELGIDEWVTKAQQQANAVMTLIAKRVSNESEKVKGEMAAARKVTTDAAIRKAYDILNALAVLQPSSGLTQLINLLFGIEDRAKLYYISGGKTSGGDKPTPTPDGGGESDGGDDDGNGGGLPSGGGEVGDGDGSGSGTDAGSGTGSNPSTTPGEGD